MAKNRLSRSELARITQKGARRVHGKLFSVVFTPLLENPSKFTCAVSVKTARRAVERNRIKRFCREAAREWIKKSDRPHAFIFYAKRGAPEAVYTDIARDIEELIRKANKDLPAH